MLLTIAGALGLTGMIGPWVVRQFRRGAREELVDALKEEFAPISVVNAFRRAVKQEVQELRTFTEATRSMAEISTRNADTALDKIREMEIRAANQWERMTERMQTTAETLERVTDRVEKIALQQARIEGERHPRGET